MNEREEKGLKQLIQVLLEELQKPNHCGKMNREQAIAACRQTVREWAMFNQREMLRIVSEFEDVMKKME